MPQNLSNKIVCPSQKVWDFDEKRLRWASVVRILEYPMVMVESTAQQSFTFFGVQRQLQQG